MHPGACASVQRELAFFVIGLAYELDTKESNHTVY